MGHALTGISLTDPLTASRQPLVAGRTGVLWVEHNIGHLFEFAM
jgi:hypothetical protein